MNDTFLDLLIKPKKLRYLSLNGASASMLVTTEVERLSPPESLVSLPHLHVLYLRKTDVNDRELLQLAKLKHLRELDVRGPRTTEAGLARFRKAGGAGVDVTWETPPRDL